MDFSQFKRGDLVRYKITDNKSGKTFMKYGIVLYTYKRHTYTYNYKTHSSEPNQQHPVLAIGVLKPIIKKEYFYPVDSKQMSTQVMCLGIKLKKRFLWKNETIEKITMIVQNAPSLSKDEQVFLSLTADLVLGGQEYSRKLKYYHEV